jgi:beta-galactosidase GanA
VVAGALTASATPAAAATHTITFDRYSLSVGRQADSLWSGEFHPYTVGESDLWRDVLQKMKASGYSSVSVYFDWGYHSPRRGVYDFTGSAGHGPVLTLAQEAACT